MNTCPECGGRLADTECGDPNCECHSGPLIHDANGLEECPADPFLISTESLHVNLLEPPPRFG